jgi:peptide chain release factor subunit 1
MEEAERAKLENFVKEIERYKGRHTELITVYIPAGSALTATAKQLEQEKSTAVNIKSKNTRKNVLEALERLTRHLKLYKETPGNGLALFCGNISEVEGQPKIELWALEPPFPLKTKLYRCDQTFVLDPLKEMLEAREIYGLIVLDRKEATLGLLEGKIIKKLRHLTSGVPGKQRAGGQSAARFERITESMAKEFYRRVGEAAKEQFFEKPRLRGLLVGGPGPTKEEFLEEGELPRALKEKIIAVKDIGYTDEFGLKILVEASSDILAKEAITQEKKILEKFFTTLAAKPEKVTYGITETKKALELGSVEELLLSTSLNKETISELESAAKAIGATVTFISAQTEEGIQFKNLGGIGAFLRFKVS